ncbi:MAG: 4Fe-4S dicluster domain-containing protein, partial [Olleya sp.]
LIVGGSVSTDLPANIEAAVQKAASELVKAGSNGVLVTGIQDVNAQTAALEINTKLGSKAFEPNTPIKTRQGNNKAVQTLIADMKAGKVGAIIMSGVNPLYTLPNASEFAEGLKNTTLSVAFTSKEDETATAVQYIAATPHYLESWGDVEFKKGHFALMQPTIRPLFDTRQFQDALLKWNGNESKLNDYIKSTWSDSILNGSSYNQALHDGVFTSTASVDTPSVEVEQDETPAGNAARALAASATGKGVELTLYSKVGMGDGQQANNPWLQEFPDPISRTSWDNYLTVSKSDAEAWNLVNVNEATGALNGSYANVKVEGKEPIKVPVIIQPGQAKGSVGLAFGYGRTAGLKDEMKTGVNAYKLYNDFNTVQNVSIEPATGMHEFACVQLQNTLMGRGDIIKETTLEIFNTYDREDHKHGWNKVPVVSLNHEETPVTSPEVDLWDSFDRSIGHHFNLSIDLNACTGCGACVIACHAENNVPVVGKEEIRRSRDMHWLRIDRYYSSNDTFEGDNIEKENADGLGLGNYIFGDREGDGSLSTFDRLEDPADNPQVAFQPVMCQHCNHAPCETVCPVAATVHGRQGQNHMAYNRCVGTRYCANNCPYKVRRFNWFLYNGNDEFDYHMNNDLGRMVINPDVTVRSRGVMEKCSMCIQKTQKTILDAKRDGREIKDGEFQTACSAACSNGAMVFGDINDKDSKVAKLLKDDRMYHLLESVGTKPNVQYHTKVRNTKET